MNADRERGFTLISALFLIVVLALVAAAMARTSVVQSSTVTMGSGGSAAFYAAKAGLEWAVYKAVKQGVACPATSAGGFHLDGFTVVVRCEASSHDDPLPRQLLHLTSVASRGTRGQPDFVERELEATVAVPAL